MLSAKRNIWLWKRCGIVPLLLQWTGSILTSHEWVWYQKSQLVYLTSWLDIEVNKLQLTPLCAKLKVQEIIKADLTWFNVFSCICGEDQKLASDCSPQEDWLLLSFLCFFIVWLPCCVYACVPVSVLYLLMKAAIGLGWISFLVFWIILLWVDCQCLYMCFIDYAHIRTYSFRIRIDMHVQ